MVDAHVSGACAARREGSSPFLGTPKRLKIIRFPVFFIFTTLPIIHPNQSESSESSDKSDRSDKSDESDEKGPQKSTNCTIKYPQIV